jgi:D-glycero-D-manno-heptose 1,7-bisphosphate phosphatase
MKRALFLDRDGVINIDKGYVSDPVQFEFVPGIIDLLRAAQAAGFLLVVITNQSGIARGYFDEQQYERIERHMRDSLLVEGVQLAAVYFCPHHPEGVRPDLAIDCSCRKPRPGMILRAAQELGLDLAASILMGDKQSDIEAAKAAGVGRAFLVEDGTADSSDSIFSGPLRNIFSVAG